jgi:hypothetical protein
MSTYVLNFGRIARVCVELTQDQAGSWPAQKEIYTPTPCQVLTINSGHSADFSQPDQLTKHDPDRRGDRTTSAGNPGNRTPCLRPASWLRAALGAGSRAAPRCLARVWSKKVSRPGTEQRADHGRRRGVGGAAWLARR